MHLNAIDALEIHTPARMYMTQVMLLKFIHLQACREILTHLMLLKCICTSIYRHVQKQLLTQGLIIVFVCAFACVFTHVHLHRAQVMLLNTYIYNPIKTLRKHAYSNV